MERSFYYLIPLTLTVAHHDRVGSLAIDHVILNKIIAVMQVSGMDSLCEDFIKAMYSFIERSISIL